MPSPENSGKLIYIFHDPGNPQSRPALFPFPHATGTPRKLRSAIFPDMDFRFFGICALIIPRRDAVVKYILKLFVLFRIYFSVQPQQPVKASGRSRSEGQRRTEPETIPAEVGALPLEQQQKTCGCTVPSGPIAAAGISQHKALPVISCDNRSLPFPPVFQSRLRTSRISAVPPACRISCETPFLTAMFPVSPYRKRSSEAHLSG